VSGLFKSLKAVLNSLCQYHVKLTPEEHRKQPGQAGEIIRELEAGMKDKVTFGLSGANSFKTLFARLPEALQLTIRVDTALKGMKKAGKQYKITHPNIVEH
jgi:hypothetical protein